MYVAPKNNRDVYSPLIISLVNNTENDIMFEYENLKLNNEMIVDLLSCPYVKAFSKKICYSKFTFFGKEPPATIDTVSFSGRICLYNDSGMGIKDYLETPPVTIEIK